MSNAQDISLMDQCFCFSDFSKEQVQQLYKIGKYEVFKEGETLIKEKEASSRLYLILSGSVKVEREIVSEGREGQVTIATLEQGSILGEISFLDKSPRTASAVAVHKTATLSWTEDEIKDKIANADGVIQHLKNNIMTEVTDRFRTTNKNYVESLRKQLETAKQQVEFGRLFLVIIILLGINSILVRLTAQKDAFINPYTISYSWVYILAVTFLLLIYMRFDFSKLREFGVTLINLKRSIIHGFLYSILLVVVILVVLFFYGVANPQYSIKQHINPALFSASAMISYPFHVYLQEFIARGALLNSLRLFYNDKPLYWPVIVSSLIFGIFHFPFGIGAAVVTFISSIIFSLIYLKDKNLIGVTIVHAIAGWLALFVGLV